MQGCVGSTLAVRTDIYEISRNDVSDLWWRQCLEFGQVQRRKDYNFHHKRISKNVGGSKQSNLTWFL
jgi:hypothetical protein